MPTDVAKVHAQRAGVVLSSGRMEEAAAGKAFQAMAINLVLLELDPEHRETQGALADLSHPSVRTKMEERARARLEEMRQGLAERGEWVSSTLV